MKTEAETQIDGQEYSKRLQEYHGLVNSSELFQWAKPKPEAFNEGEVEEDPISKLLHSNTQIFERSDQVLQAGTLQYQKLKPANSASLHQSVVTSVQFHPSECLLLTTGLDRKAKLINVQATLPHQIVQEIYLPDLPIYKAQFIRQGKEIVFCGNRRHFYSFDLSTNKLEKQGAILGHHDEQDLSNMVASPGSKYFAFACKKSGYILVIGQDSKKLLFDLKMNGSCNSIVFSKDERFLWSVGDEAEIYQWDLVKRRCVKKIADEGGFNTVKLALSPNG